MPDRVSPRRRRLGFFQLVVPTLEDETLELRGGEARHLRRSVRAHAGDRVPACDGRGARGELEILSVSADRVVVRPVLEARESEPACRLWVATRAADARFDWLVEKAVELGAWGILPLEAARPGAPGRDRPERWWRLARAAAEQCGTAWLPTVGPARRLESLLKESDGPRFASALVADPGGTAAEALPLGLPGPGDHLLVAGPPEGFDPAERAALAEFPRLTRVALGPRRLRSETAALALLAWAGLRSEVNSPVPRP